MTTQGPLRHVAQVTLTIIIILSTTLNSIVIGAYLKSHRKLPKNNTIIVSLAVSDLLQALLGYSSEVKWLFSGERSTMSSTTCQVQGFFVSFMAYVSIAHLVYLCLERGLALKKPYLLSALSESPYFIPLIILGLWFYGLFWSVMPLLGWSTYAVEQDGCRCSIDWRNKSTASHVYIGALFIFCFVAPVVFIVVSLVFVKHELNRMQRRANTMFGSASSTAGQLNSTQRRAIRMVFTMVTSYMIAWTPYAAMALLITSSVSKIPDELLLSSAMAAKSSTCFNPIIYAIVYGSFRKALREIFQKSETFTFESQPPLIRESFTSPSTHHQPLSAADHLPVPISKTTSFSRESLR